MLKSRRFVLLAGLVGLAAVVSLLFLYRYLILDALMVQETRSNEALTHTFANSLWPAYAEFLGTAGRLEAEQIRARPETQRLRSARNQGSGLGASWQGRSIQRVGIPPR